MPCYPSSECITQVACTIAATYSEYDSYQWYFFSRDRAYLLEASQCTIFLGQILDRNIEKY